MEDIVVNFLGEEYSFPSELRDYVFYCKKFQRDRDILLEVMYKRIDEKWYEFPDEKFDTLLRTVCKRTLQYLSEDDIFDVTEEDLLKNNKGYSEFLNMTQNYYKKKNQLLADEIQKYTEGYKNAYNDATSQITGSGYGLISNSIIAHMTFAAMESGTIRKQSEKANKELKRNLSDLSKETQSEREKREAELLYKEIYPTYINLIEIFISEIIDEYLSILENKGVYQYSKVKPFNIDRSMELLNNINIVKNKRRVIIEAFKNCPYNVYVYLKTVDLNLMDIQTKKTVEIFGQKEILVDLIEERIIEAIEIEKDADLVKANMKGLALLNEEQEKTIYEKFLSPKIDGVKKRILELCSFLNDTCKQMEIIETLKEKAPAPSATDMERYVKEYIEKYLDENEIYLLGNIIDKQFWLDILSSYNFQNFSLESFKYEITKKLTKNIQELNVAVERKEEERIKKNERQSVIKKMGIGCLVILIVCFPSLSKLYKYQSAERKLKENSYSEAIQIWEELGNYSDSQKKLVETKSEMIKESFEDSNSEEAIYISNILASELLSERELKDYVEINCFSMSESEEGYTKKGKFLEEKGEYIILFDHSMSFGCEGVKFRFEVNDINLKEKMVNKLTEFLGKEPVEQEEWWAEWKILDMYTCSLDSWMENGELKVEVEFR